MEYNHLNAAADLLMLISDDLPEFKNTCNLTAKQALELIYPLHALIDQTQKVEKISNNKNQSKIINSSELIKKAQQTSSWFCQSILLKKLKSELIHPPASGL